MKTPFSVLDDFIKASTSVLQKFPLEHYNFTDIPDASILLDDHRLNLLSEQSITLQQVVAEYNLNHSFPDNNYMTQLLDVNTVQDCLRQFAHSSKKDLIASISFETNDSELISRQMDDLCQNMNRMNEEARLALVRCILYVQTRHHHHHHQEQDLLRPNSTDFNPSDVIEFCALCQIALQMEEVQHFICRHTHDLFPNTDGENSCSVHNNNTSLSPQQRILQIQSMILLSMGFDPSSSLSQLDDWIQQGHVLNSKDSPTSDLEFFNTLSNYVSLIKTITTNSTIQNNHVIQLSDHKEGGVTRIVSVTYSEKHVTTDDPPKQELMEQQVEKAQREALEMAKKAATLHQSFLNELLAMDEADRDKTLLQAKIQHEEFIKSVQALPIGADRVHYLRSLDPHTQKMLILYSSWQKRLESHSNHTGREDLVPNSYL